jgi:hypothetical protein
MRITDIITEVASSSTTSSSDITTVVSPHIAIGNKEKRKRYGQKGENPSPPKAKMQTPKHNALNMMNTSIFGGPIKR